MQLARWPQVLCLVVIVVSCADAEANTVGCDFPRQDVPPSSPSPPAEVRRTTSFGIDRAEVDDPFRGASFAKWPALPEAARTILRSTLPKLELGPGETLHIGYISHDSSYGGETIFTETLARARWPIFPGLPLLETVKPDDFCRKQKATIERNNARIRQYREIIQTLVDGWNNEQSALKEAFIGRALKALSEARLERDTIATDIAGALNKGVGLARKTEASTAVIVLFSDMTGPLWPLADLHGITVVVALYDRRDAADRARGEREWTDHLRGHGATVPPFLTWTETTEVTLLGRLRGAL